jgi:hypothetical protein
MVQLGQNESLGGYLTLRAVVAPNGIEIAGVRVEGTSSVDKRDVASLDFGSFRLAVGVFRLSLAADPVDEDFFFLGPVGG